MTLVRYECPTCHNAVTVREDSTLKAEVWCCTPHTRPVRMLSSDPPSNVQEPGQEAS